MMLGRRFPKKIRKELRKRTRVAVLVPRFAEKPFIMHLVHGVLMACGQRGLEACTRVLGDNVPVESGLETFVSRRDDYRGAIILPVRPSPGDAQALRDFVKEFHRPVVFLDVDLFVDGPRKLPWGAALVACDNRVGGRLAADFAGKLVAHTARFSVLVVAASFQKQRQESFVKRLAQLRGTEAEVQVANSCEFSRDAAKDAVEGAVRSAIGDGKRIDVVFATNDEMALGALDAFDKLRPRWSTSIIGFDGIPEVVQAVSSASRSAVHARIRGTIGQDPAHLGQSAVTKIRELAEKRVKDPRQLIKPRLLKANGK